MATKSFTTEFKFSSKSVLKLINAIDNSEEVNYKINQKVNNATNEKDIIKIMDSFLGKK